MQVVFIGAGNVATSLSVALQNAGYGIAQVWSRTEESAAKLANRLQCPHTTEWQQIDNSADLYVYCLPDDVLTIMPVVAAPNAIHIHTACSLDTEVFDKSLKHKGVFYPFQTFSKDRIINFTDIPILIEASDEQTEIVLNELAAKISKKIYRSTLDSRKHLHIAGVFANNFSNCMYALAAEQLKKAGLPFDILLPLIDETAEKVHTIEPRKAQTGPARRKDLNIINQHIELLDDDAEKQIYKLITENIINYES